MTDQQYTPDTEQVRLDYIQSCEGDRVSDEESGPQFDRWLATVEAAAEQRGAIKALTDFRRFATRVMPDEVQSKHVIADINIALKRIHNDNHLLMGPLAADLLEGDDA